MTAISNYKIDIIPRTKEILEAYYPHFNDNNREVTFLMNCLLGIIVAISENENSNRKNFGDLIDEEFLSYIPQKIGYINSKNIAADLTNMDLTEIGFNVQHKENLVSKSKYWLINKLRNGIAHQNIEEVNNDLNWVGVRISNLHFGKKDFEIIFQIEELKQFSIYIANKFIEKN